MTAITIIVAAAMLLFGRRLFWVFVAGVGFLYGAMVAAQFLQGAQGWILLVIAAAAGIIGALIALLAQKIAIGVAGFLGGGYLAYEVALQVGASQWAWILFLIGAIIGAILFIVLFDWALIIMSSLIGAAVISQELPLVAPWPALVFLGLLILGLVVQFSQLQKPAPSSRSREE